MGRVKNTQIDIDNDGLVLDALEIEAAKALRHALEEEMRALTLAERIERVVGLIETDATVAIRRAHASNTTGWVATCGSEHTSKMKGSIDEALVDLGADILEKLEKQAAGLRGAVAQLEAKIQGGRGQR